MYAVLLCQIRIRGMQENMDETEYDFLLSGGDIVGSNVTAASAGLPDFISDEIAQRVKEFMTLACFKGLTEHVASNLDQWKEFIEHGEPEKVIPLCWEGAGTNRKL
jgi:dynein heavy chain 1